MIWRRRKSIVNPRQQIWFGMELVALFVGFVVMCAFFLFIPPVATLIGPDELNTWVLDEMMKIVLLRWPLVFAALLILLVIGVLMSHRLAGPLYGLERVIKAWQEGNRSARVRFRKYDYLLPAMEPLNSFLDGEEKLLAEVETLAGEIASESTEAGVKAKAARLAELVKKEKVGS